MPKQGKAKFCSSYHVKNVPETFETNFLNQISCSLLNDSKEADILDLCGLLLNRDLTWDVLHWDI